MEARKTMAGKNNDTNMPMVHCSFCGKTEKQVHKLIAGPNGVYICDECVETCAEIVEEEVYQAQDLSLIHI